MTAIKASAATVSLAAGARISEIDMMRGFVIVLMALDHVRDYFLGGPGMAGIGNLLDPVALTAACRAVAARHRVDLVETADESLVLATAHARAGLDDEPAHRQRIARGYEPSTRHSEAWPLSFASTAASGCVSACPSRSMKNT